MAHHALDRRSLAQRALQLAIVPHDARMRILKSVRYIELGTNLYQSYRSIQSGVAVSDALPVKR